jgi:hypothetical protein
MIYASVLGRTERMKEFHVHDLNSRTLLVKDTEKKILETKTESQNYALSAFRNARGLVEMWRLGTPGCVPCSGNASLRTLSSDATGKLDVLGHNRNSFRMDCAEVRVLEQAYNVRFSRFLKCHNGATLEPKVGLELLSDLADEALERQLAD